MQSGRNEAQTTRTLALNQPLQISLQSDCSFHLHRNPIKKPKVRWNYDVRSQKFNRTLQINEP